MYKKLEETRHPKFTKSSFYNIVILSDNERKLYVFITIF